MARKVLSFPKGSQMDNPTLGTGSGHDRCTEMVAAMFDDAYLLGAMAKAGDSTETIMDALTRMLNNGSPYSSPENMGVWFPAWLSSNGYDKILSLQSQPLTFASIVALIDRDHAAIGGFNDYVSLRLIDGSNPYKWTDPHGLGHVLAIVGYDTDEQAVVVHDPLRADPGGQPADYSWSSFLAAQLSDITEVVGPALPIAMSSGGGSPTGGTGTVQLSDVAEFFEAYGDGWRCKVTGHVVRGEVLNEYQSWEAHGTMNGFTAFGMPTTDEIVDQVAPAGHPTPVHQDFERGRIRFDPERVIDHPMGTDGRQCYAAHYEPPDVSALNAEIASLKQQLASQPPPSPAPDPDPKATAVITALSDYITEVEKKAA